MKSKTRVKASAEPPLPTSSAPQDTTDRVAQLESNASQPLGKSRVRQKASADQATLQDKGANALPVSDYPLRVGPYANTLDRHERVRARKGAH